MAGSDPVFSEQGDRVEAALQAGLPADLAEAFAVHPRNAALQGVVPVAPGP